MIAEGWGAPPSEVEPEAGIGHNSGWGVEPVAEVAPVVTYEVKYAAQPETEEPECFRLRRNAELERWLATRQTAATAKTDEMDWRNKVTKTLFPMPTKGTQRYDIGGGYMVKLVHKLTYTLGNKDAVDESSGKKMTVRAQVEALEEKVAKMGEAERVLFETLVTWNPEISGTKYEALNEKDEVHVRVRAAIDELLTIKPASPTLEFEEPKESG
jgi:hypothetical protein